jgi:hypothetical protein
MLINVRRTLAVIGSICILHVIFFIKNYTYKFHVVPSFRRKKSVDRSTSMREVDGLGSYPHLSLCSSAHTTTPLR